MNNWNRLDEKFASIISDNYEYNILLNRILLSQNNTLLYSPLGFPIDLFIDLIIKIDKCVECRKLDSSARKRITSFTHNNKEYLKK